MLLNMASAQIQCIIERVDDFVEIVIADNGKGLPEEVIKELDDLLDRFPVICIRHGKGVGLKFANKALAEARMGLKL